MTEEIKQPQLRAVQYFFVDGSFEFGFGLLCLILAAFFYAETHVQGWLSALVDGSLVLVLVGGAWLINRLIKYLKERITWPRTGYITYSRKKGLSRAWNMAIGMAAGGLVGGASLVLMKTPNLHLATMPLISGFLFGLVMVILGWRARLGRFYLLAVLSLAAGIITAFSGLENTAALSVYYLAFGLALIITGVWVLRAYLRHNPVITEVQP
jgi:hypothetical protein